MDSVKANVNNTNEIIGTFICQGKVANGKQEALKKMDMNLELMKHGFPPIDIKFVDCLSYYNAFDEYHVKYNLHEMEKLFAGYINE